MSEYFNGTHDSDATYDSGTIHPNTLKALSKAFHEKSLPQIAHDLLPKMPEPVEPYGGWYPAAETPQYADSVSKYIQKQMNFTATYSGPPTTVSWHEASSTEILESLISWKEMMAPRAPFVPSLEQT